MLIILNFINLSLFFFFFFITYILLVNGEKIKKEINGKEKEEEKTPMWKINLISGFFSYLTLYFILNFYYQSFFGVNINDYLMKIYQ